MSGPAAIAPLLTIAREPGGSGYFEVAYGEDVSQPLAFCELLEVVVALTHPDLPHTHRWMESPAARAARLRREQLREQDLQRMAEPRTATVHHINPQEKA